MAFKAFLSAATFAVSARSRSVMVAGGDGAAHRRPVTVGLQDDGKVQITSGLTVNDLVISNGGYGLDDGTKVKVVAAEDADKTAAGKNGEDK